jgi:hypothetical protein
MTDQDPKPPPTPPSIDEMKAAIKANHERLVRELGEKRRHRHQLNTSIAGLVAQLREAERLVKALEPKRRKT